MGTRGSIGFRIDGKDYLAYNHSDSYPSGLGTEFVAEVKKLIKDKKLAEKVRAIRLVKRGDKPTPADVEKLKPYTDLGVGNQSTSDWYCLLRNAQGSLKATIDSGYILDNATFIHDSLFCEYAYILNLDTGNVEFYKGFNKDRKAAGRYAAIESKDRDGKFEEYCGCVLAAEFPANAIPKDWEKKAFPPEKDE
jgi:hypothetical protein